MCQFCFCVWLCYIMIIFSREDIRTANVIAAEAVTCLVIDREWVSIKFIPTGHNDCSTLSVLLFVTIKKILIWPVVKEINKYGHAKLAHKLCFAHYGQVYGQARTDIAAHLKLLSC